MKESMLQRYLRNGLLHGSEEVIVRSALERAGAFNRHCKLYATIDAEHGSTLLLYDGKVLYPLGSRERIMCKDIEEIPFQMLLGRAEVVHKIENDIGLSLWNAESHRTMAKIYALLDNLNPLYTEMPDGCSVEPASNLNDLAIVCHFRNKFRNEELELDSTVKDETKLDIDALRAFKPFLLRSGGKVVAAVCSTLQSKEITMVNTLYVEEEYRKKGLATLLLHKYIVFLMKNTKSVCLFYSPENEAADHIYLSLGFKPTDMWKMTVATGQNAKFKLTVV